MAAFLTHHLFGPNLTRGGSSVFARLRLDQRRSALPGSELHQMLAAGSEIVLFLWMVVVLAFSLLVTTCFFL
jgi:hypothetical protein